MDKSFQAALKMQSQPQVGMQIAAPVNDMQLICMMAATIQASNLDRCPRECIEVAQIIMIETFVKIQNGSFQKALQDRVNEERAIQMEEIQKAGLEVPPDLSKGE